jgi:NADH-quinone oxidoreductase subunit C
MVSRKKSKKGKKKPGSKGKRRMALKDVGVLLVDEFGNKVEKMGIRNKGRTKVLEFSIPNSFVYPVCDFLHGKGFEHCSMITAVDWKDRFDIIYHITSYKHALLLEMRTVLPHEKPEVDSVASIWGGADWHEREAWDLMGIVFKGHPNLKRILLPQDWKGHPLRKDYKEVP